MTRPLLTGLCIGSLFGAIADPNRFTWSLAAAFITVRVGWLVHDVLWWYAQYEVQKKNNRKGKK